MERCIQWGGSTLVEQGDDGGWRKEVSAVPRDRLEQRWQLLSEGCIVRHHAKLKTQRFFLLRSNTGRGILMQGFCFLFPGGPYR